MAEESHIAVVGVDFSEHEAPDEISKIKIGQWYWVKEEGEDDGEDDGEDRYHSNYNENGEFSAYQAMSRDKSRYDESGRWLGCVTKIGSNYIRLTSAKFETRDSSWQYRRRVHMENFFEVCEFEPNANSIIRGKIEQQKSEAGRLMNEVKRITGQLGVSPRGALQDSGDETQALAVRNGDTDFDEYRVALNDAKEVTLPNLFKEMKFHHGLMVGWMNAETIPMRVESKAQESVLEQVEDRIFSVELYAGLIENIVLIADGEAADNDEKLHLMQRRCYMDEECLARYEAGGMEFSDIGKFDAWLSRPENRDRILPFPRCMVSFRVRRNKKERGSRDHIDLLRFIQMDELNELTFLYIRNGDKIYRLDTEIEFEEKMFPDLERSVFSSGQQIWAKKGTFASDGWGLATQDQYEDLIREYKKQLKDWRKKHKAWKAEKKAWKAKSEEYREGHSRERPSPFEPYGRPDNPEGKWIKFNQDTVFYDDISGRIEKDIKAYNRIALIIQGIFDRSEALSPHPPYQIWTAEGFGQAIALQYDDTRALNPADLPDFEAFRAKLNESFGKGSIAVGQEDFWERAEAKKECERRDNDWRDRGHFRPKRYRPRGNPGPGQVALVTSMSKKKGTCSFKWEKKRRRSASAWESGSKTVPARAAVPIEELLNISAYKPGDFRQFFDDPRTRMEYIKWAPFLLAAEEYHAGNLELGKPS